MVSHKKFGGIELSLGAGGLRFKKRPSSFNMCIGNIMRGQPGPTNGGRYDKGFQGRFSGAARRCAVGGTKRTAAFIERGRTLPRFR